MRAGLKLLAINVLVALGLLGMLELGYRAMKFAASCARSECDGRYWALGSKFRTNRAADLSRPDPILGYAPKDGEHLFAWSRPTRVKIRNGLRAHTAGEGMARRPVTLAVGDSFTFGDEVCDSDTWPACLQRRLRSPVLNGGVFGYGAAQAVLRARQLTAQQPLDRIIWSILVDHDFARDRLAVRSGKPRPAVIRTGGVIRYSSIEESQQVLQRTLQTGIAKYAALFGYSYISQRLWERLSPYVLPPGTRFDGRWDVAHPDAAPAMDIMRFAFVQYAALPARHKYVLLQYPEPGVRRLPATSIAEIEAIRRLAAEHNLVLIDSLPALRAAPDLTRLYRGHHTAAGNQLVCAVVASAIMTESTLALAPP